MNSLARSVLLLLFAFVVIEAASVYEPAPLQQTNILTPTTATCKPTAMDIFLSSIHPRLEVEPEAHVILVTGNESADLDSIVSALAASMFLSRLPANKGSIVAPYINIPKIDLALRSDVEYILSTSHINSDFVFFRDDLPRLEQLASKNLLSLFLVDHNKVSGTMSSLQAAKVVGVIDHHVDENLYKDTANPRRIEVVGSCASLVADEFFKNAINSSKDEESSDDEKKIPDWIQQVSRLMLGPILIDTMDLNPEMKKVKPLDAAMAKLIFPYTGWESMNDLYSRIDVARRNTSSLSYYDLLRKDYKEWTVTHKSTGQDVKVGISSVVGLMDKFAKRDGKEGIQQAIDRWAMNRTLDLSLVLLADDPGEENGGYQRQLIVNPVSSSMKDFPGQMEKISHLQLERTDIVDTDEFVKRGGCAYLQKNSTCTRKQIWPLVEKLLTQPSETSNL
ncbi:Exopolyphosphatase [Dissophora ornata]|nr:Exopolyphosphatase [Dissophora ornata]